MISAEEIKTDHVNKMPQYYEVRGINNEADNKLFFSLKIVAMERRQPLMEHDMKTPNKKYSKLRIFWVDIEKGLGFAFGKRMKDGGVDYMKVGENVEWEMVKKFGLK